MWTDSNEIVQEDLLKTAKKIQRKMDKSLLKKKLKTDKRKHSDKDESVLDDQLLSPTKKTKKGIPVSPIKHIDKSDLISDIKPLSPSKVNRKDHSFSPKRVQVKMEFASDGKVPSPTKTSKNDELVSPKKRKSKKDIVLDDQLLSPTKKRRKEHSISPSPEKLHAEKESFTDDQALSPSKNTRANNPVSPKKHTAKSDLVSDDKMLSPTNKRRKNILVSPRTSPNKRSHVPEMTGFKEHQDADTQLEESEPTHIDTERLEDSIRYKIKDEFKGQTVGEMDNHVNLEDLSGKELWLIKAPTDVDIDDLSKHIITSNGITDLQINDKTLQVMMCPGEDTQRSKYCPIIPSKKKKTLHAGLRFSGSIHVVESIKVPFVPIFDVPPPPKITIPDGLKPRFVPFGAEQPLKIHSPKIKHDKKKKSKKKRTKED